MPESEEGRAIDSVDIDQGVKDAVHDGPLDGTELEQEGDTAAPEEEENTAPASDGPVP